MQLPGPSQCASLLFIHSELEIHMLKSTILHPCRFPFRLSVQTPYQRPGYAFSVSFGRVRISFMISLSSSPATANISLCITLRTVEEAFHSTLPLTCPPIVPVHRDRPLKQTLVLLELPQCVGCASRVPDHAASFGGAKVLQDAGQLIGGGSSLLNI